MHLNRGQITKLFREKSDPRIVSDDPADLMAATRRKLRQALYGRWEFLARIFWWPTRAWLARDSADNKLGPPLDCTTAQRPFPFLGPRSVSGALSPAEADVSHDDHFGLRVNDAVAQRGVPQSGIYD